MGQECWCENQALYEALPSPSRRYAGHASGYGPASQRNVCNRRRQRVFREVSVTQGRYKRERLQKKPDRDPKAQQELVPENLTCDLLERQTRYATRKKRASECAFESSGETSS